MNLLDVVREVRRHLEENGRLSLRMLRRQFDLGERIAATRAHHPIPLLPRNARFYGAHKALVNRLGMMVFLSPQETQRRVPRARRGDSARPCAAERSPDSRRAAAERPWPAAWTAARRFSRSPWKSKNSGQLSASGGDRAAPGGASFLSSAVCSISRTGAPARS